MTDHWMRFSASSTLGLAMQAVAPDMSLRIAASVSYTHLTLPTKA